MVTGTATPWSKARQKPFCVQSSWAFGFEDGETVFPHLFADSRHDWSTT
jgi:hypothetical protein